MNAKLLVALAALTMAAFLPASATADSSGGSRVCDSKYALCSSAQCRTVLGDPAHVTCSCEGPLHGLNIGDSACRSREEHITSTFSLWDLTKTSNKPAKVPMRCDGANANRWAFCLDAPCRPQAGGVACTCKLAPKSAYTIFANACAADGRSLHANCAKIWSSANSAELDSGYSQLTPFYGYPPKLAYCPALKGSSGRP